MYSSRKNYMSKLSYRKCAMIFTTQSTVLPWQVICLSVHLSVTVRYCGYIVGVSWKITTCLVRLGTLLSAAHNIINLDQGNFPKFHVE